MATFAIETERNGSDELVLRCTFPAPREKVFRAWTEPKWLAQWLCPADGSGVMIEDFDLSVGKGFRLTMLFEDGHQTVVVEFLEISSPERLRFTWQWLTNEETPEPTEVRIVLSTQDGGCAMTMTHSRFATAGYRDHHREGWESCLRQLNNFVSKE
jgi:uncharacterized protein YndB with AHSA1/START domain